MLLVSITGKCARIYDQKACTLTAEIGDYLAGQYLKTAHFKNMLESDFSSCHIVHSQLPATVFTRVICAPVYFAHPNFKA
jgi:hypothetical protein